MLKLNRQLKKKIDFTQVFKVRRLKLRRNKCKTCPFGGGSNLFSVNTIDGIKNNVINGINHICHSEDKYICRGARNYCLNMWHRMGRIESPTDEGLYKAMISIGIEPIHQEYGDL
jgi:hypothetical protein